MVAILEKENAGEEESIIKKEGISEKEIFKVLREMCIPPNLKGYAYIKTAVKLVYDNYKLYKNALMKDIYIDVAAIYKTTQHSVERDIRHAKEYAFNIPISDVTKEIFGSQFLYNELPTNAEFIFSIAEYISVMR